MVPFPGAFPRSVAGQVGFTREELTRILDLYGRMVSAGEWRDYAMDFTRDFAAFAAETLAVAAREYGEDSEEADAVRTAWAAVGVVNGDERS